MIVLDSLRADHVSALHTPFLMELSERATVFERAVAPAAWTLPSHVSMLTGLSPSEHQIQSRGGVRPTLASARHGLTRLINDGRYLPAWLLERGVDTFLGSSIGWLSPASGVGRGFGNVAYIPFPPGTGKRPRSTPSLKDGQAALPDPVRRLPIAVKHAAKIALETLAEARRALPLAKWVLSREDKGASRLEAAFANWLSNVDRPFFAFINLIETHDPHIAPKGHGRRDVRSMIAAVGGKSFTRKMNQHNWGYRPLPSHELERLKNAYLAETSYADLCVRRIVSHVSDLGLGGDTTIIVTADHGEGFGEHGLVGHGLPLTESVLHVPLLVAPPSAEPQLEPRVVGLDRLAASVATILTDDAGPFGHASFVRDEGRGSARSEVEAPGRYFHTSGLKMKEVASRMDRPAAAFYYGPFKLIVGSFWDEALFDLVADPTESHNLIGEREIPGPLADMRRRWERRSGLT